MRVQITCQPSYAIAYCYLDVDEALLVERGAMAAMSDGLDVTVGIGPGGVAKAAMRRMFGGEGFFMGKYTAMVHGAWVACSPPFPGDIAQLNLAGDGMIVEAGSLLAAEARGVDVDVKYSGLRGIVMREGITMLRVSGYGLVLVGSYGGIQEFNLEPGQRMTVDTGHLVGFSDTMKPEITMIGGVTASVLSGEGLVANFTGPGRVLLQTRAEQQLSDWLFPSKAQNTGKS